jgi:hypothetical protein
MKQLGKGLVSLMSWCRTTVRSVFIAELREAAVTGVPRDVLRSCLLALQFLLGYVALISTAELHVHTC